jgi:DNA polymerase elongation subunit (family B)
LVKKYNLEETGKVQQIRSGDKIKFIYLKEPNPIRENVIGFFEKMPEEFKIDQYIDYEMQFSKTMLKPLSGIMEIFSINNFMKWLEDSKESIDNFFM